MDHAGIIAELDELLRQLRAAGWKERETVLVQLRAVVENSGARSSVLSHLEEAKRVLPLEARWDVEEVIEAFTVVPEPDPVEEAPEEEEAPKPDAPLSMADLDRVYDDPRGLVLYKAKKSERWFASQVDPQTGQPQMFELGSQEVIQMRTQLMGSPYWVQGAGGAA
jgi:hypothetical protein